MTGLRRLGLRGCLCAVLACAFFGLSAGPALAHWGWPSSFGKGQLSDPVGVAVDEAGDVYVGNVLFVGNDEYDTSHNLVSPPSPFGGANVFSGVALNPVSHDVYVVNAESQAVDTFDPSSGALLSSFSVPGTANLFGAYTVVQIASDAAGNVYVPNAPNNEIQVFSPTGEAPSGGVAASIAGSGANTLKAPEGVAVDSSGDVWVADTGNNRIEEFEPNGTFVKEVPSPGVKDVTVDAAGDVFASVDDSSGAHVVEYGPTGARIDDFGLGILKESEFGTPNSIAMDAQRGLVYVADGGDNVVWAFATWGVVTRAASHVTSTGATFNGTVEIEPGSEPVTSCRFEYGTTTSYGQTAPCSPAGPYSATTGVSAEVGGLTADTVHHYRIVATNAVGVTQVGEDHVIGPPLIASESAGAAVDSASLRAKVNPYGVETSCLMQYVPEAEFEVSGYADATTLPCSPAILQAEFAEDGVSAATGALTTDAVYHYRFIATNGVGTATGADQTFATFGIKSFSFGPLDQSAKPFTQAGGHPYELTDAFALNTSTNQFGNSFATDANPKDIRTELPPGLIGNPDATPKCSAYNVAHADCSGASQVGVLKVYTANPGHVESHGAPEETQSPIYNLVPPKGLAAQFGARFNGFVTVHIDAKVRTGSDYGVTAEVLNSSAGEGLVAAEATLWGVPAEESHNAERYCPKVEKVNEEAPCSEHGSLKPFLTNPTSCSGPLSANMHVDSWQEPGVFVDASAAMPAFTGCERLDFKPALRVQPDATVTESPTGLHVDLRVPQNENPGGLAEADLKDATVALPQGMTVNPASAGGLAACSPEQIELHGPEPARCPDASKIGAVTIETPLLEHLLTGGVYVAQQGNAGAAQGANPFGSLLAIYIAVYDPQSGVVVKLAGHVSLEREESNGVVAKEAGQLTTTFDENPQLPFEDLKLELFNGPRAPLVTPSACGTYTTTSSLTPWSAPGSGPPATPSDSFGIVAGPNGTACAPPGFSPTLTAGTASNRAAAFSPFTFTLVRNDGEQTLSTVTTKMPAGLEGMLSRVSLCGEAQANAGQCPASSQIGHVTILAGVGTDPVVLPQAGRPQDPVYITGPYKGAPFGLSIVVPAEAGPFNLDENGHAVVVRARIEVDPHTGQVTVASDPMPTMLQGIPVDVRTVNVTVDREGFTFNPTDCEPLSATGTITSAQGATANVSSRFQAADCASLSFKPSFSALTHASHSRANGEYLHVVVQSKQGEANIAKVHVELPKTLPSRLSTLNLACSEAQFAANPAGCPAGSFVGTVTAQTPVLPVPMTGPAIFVSHGGAAFPNLDFVLQGDGVTITLIGDTFINKQGITSSTYASVPDVPVTRFDLVLPAGPHSVLSATGDPCVGKLLMPTTITGQNGAQVTQNTKIAVSGCKPVIRVLRHTARGRAATITVSVPSAGKLVASGDGLSRAVKRFGKTGTATVRLTLSANRWRLLAHHPGRRLRVRVRLRFVPAHGAALSSTVAVLMG